MEIYGTLGDYLAAHPHSGNPLRLRGSDRPFIRLDPGDSWAKNYPFLRPWGTGQGSGELYEVGFPWVQVADWEDQGDFYQNVTLETSRGQVFHLSLGDETLDETQIRNDEGEIERLKTTLGDRFEHLTADTLAIAIGLFSQLFGPHGRQESAPCLLLTIPRIVGTLSQEEARLPLILSLDRKYQLRGKLELMAPKLRSQLNRTAEMMKLGRIQEMDAYCLRDYIRRPGRDATEKAGDRQELLAIQRYQNFNTPENRFLKGFCNYLHLECLEYKEYAEARRLQQTIERFRQEPSVQTITRSHNFAGKPNYVLQQNPIYRSFYQAYLDYVKRQTEKQNLWGYRQGLLVEIVQVLMVGAMVQLQGSYGHPTHTLQVQSTPRQGRYLLPQEWPPVDCVLGDRAFSLRMIPAKDPRDGDFTLQLTRQDFATPSAPPRTQQWKIWVFCMPPGQRF